MREPKQIVYYYNGDQANPDLVRDFDGEIWVPQKDEVIERNRQRWKVIIVNEERTVSMPAAIPVYRVFLQSI